MKIAAPYLLLLLLASHATAQTVVTSLNEDFNTNCATIGPNYGNWTQYNVIPPISPLAWNCAPLSGRWNTPGMSCNSYYSGVYYLDTAWLISPLINLSGNDERTFLRYDSRYEFTAAKLSLKISYNFEAGLNPERSGVDWLDVTSSTSPVIGPSDSANWVTHWLDLTPYKSIPFFVAFRFVSTTYSGGTWTIDNVMTTSGLGAPDLRKNQIALTVVGNSSTDIISLSADITEPGTYATTVLDVTGRKVYETELFLHNGLQRYTLKNLSLSSGMYFVRMANGSGVGYARTIVY